MYFVTLQEESNSGYIPDLCFFILSQLYKQKTIIVELNLTKEDSFAKNVIVKMQNQQFVAVQTIATFT